MTAPEQPKLHQLHAFAVSIDRLIEAADRLAASEENAFLQGWLPSLISPKPPPLAIRLALASRMTGALDEARTLLAALQPTEAWSARDLARLEHERAWFALVDGKPDLAREHLSQGLRAKVSDPEAGPSPELVDLYLLEARLESSENAWELAKRALDHAAHVAERLPPGPWRVQLEVNMGYLLLRLGKLREAHEAFTRAHEIAPPSSRAALSAHSGNAVALCIIGSFDEARAAALEGIELAGRIGVRWRLADMWDTLGLVEFVADRPHAALRAVDEGFAILGAEKQDTLRFALLMHRATVLSVLGRGRASEQALSLAETVRQRMGALDRTYELAWAVARARFAESRGEHEEVERLILPVLDGSRHYGAVDARFTLARALLAQDKVDEAYQHVEEGSLLAAEASIVIAERKQNLGVFALGLSSHDSRVVRYADSMLKRLVSERALPPFDDLPERSRKALVDWQNAAGAQPIWLTTRFGVARVPMDEAEAEAERVILSVNSISHELRIGKKKMTLTRHRALEPLLVQMLRRADSGLSRDEILTAAGGPGPGSADADHRVRVLISRLRALLGPEAPIVTARAAGEGARAHYRLSPQVEFALIEPAEEGD